METKKLFLTPALLFSLLMALTMVSGTITFVTPSTAGDSVTGNYTFNLTSTLTAVRFCNWSTSSDSNFLEFENVTANIFNVTFDTASLTDAEDTTLTVNCSNVGGTASEIGTLTINVDNTNPTCSFTLPIGDNILDYMDAYGIYPADASSDTTDLTYAWILYDPSGNSKETDATSSPNFAGEDFDELGEFTLSLIVTDEVSKSNACTNLTIDVKSANGDTVTQIVLPKIITENKTTAMVIGGVLLLLIIGGVGYFVVIKSKK